MITNKVRKREEIIKLFRDGMKLAVGGQATMGVPYELLELVLESGVRHLTTMSIDAGDTGYALGRLLQEGVIDKMYVCHTGTNADATRLLDEGKIEVEFNPIGTLVERMRCGGYGLGGVLTKTGLGTIVEKGKQIVQMDGEDYILEPALKADVALVHAFKADTYGNLELFGTDMNDNPIVATCGAVTIVEAETICSPEELDIRNIRVPGGFVDMILDTPIASPIHKDASTRWL